METTLSVLDAQAIVAALIGEPAAAQVELLLRDAVDRPNISAANLAETIDVLMRLWGWAEMDVIEKIDWLVLGGLEVVDVNEARGLLAGEIRARQYHRADRPVSLADCLALATALTLGQRLATSDPALLAAAQSEGCAATVLPDSRGRITDKHS